MPRWTLGDGAADRDSTVGLPRAIVVAAVLLAPASHLVVVAWPVDRTTVLVLLLPTTLALALVVVVAFATYQLILSSEPD